MSVITFVNNLNEQTGKTLSLVAIATNMALENNNRILIISTTNKKDRVKECLWSDKKVRRSILGGNLPTVDITDGIQGIVKMTKSNKLTPEMVTNFTKVVFKDRLEIITGREDEIKKDNENQLKNDIDDDNTRDISEDYIKLVNAASKYYDEVFVDLDDNINEKARDAIIKISDLIIVNSSQNRTSIKKIKENKEKDEILKSPKTLILIGRYDKYSKYNIKNITRELGEKNKVLTVPYNTLYFEASNEAKVPDLFLDLKRKISLDDRNAIFMEEVKRATENIQYRIKKLQSNF